MEGGGGHAYFVGIANFSPIMIFMVMHDNFWQCWQNYNKEKLWLLPQIHIISFEGK